MNELAIPQNNFINIHNKAYRLAAAVFMISNVMDKDEELRTKFRRLSLDMVSLSVNLKDSSVGDAKKTLSEMEKNSLELMSLIDIASIAGLISKMNGDIIKGEFQAFVSELAGFTQTFEENKNTSVKNVFAGAVSLLNAGSERPEAGSSPKTESADRTGQKAPVPHGVKNHNGLRRKDLRKSAIFEFIKGHNNVSIKDIFPNVTGCSEKTIQRELMALIKEGKIKKTGERRWSKYSIS